MWPNHWRAYSLLIDIAYDIECAQYFWRWKICLRKNSSSDREFLLRFKAEGREFAKILRSLEWFVFTVKGQNNFWWQNAFSICSWSFCISNKFEKLKFILKKNIGIEKHAAKVRKISFLSFTHKKEHKLYRLIIMRSL